MVLSYHCYVETDLSYVHCLGVSRLRDSFRVRKLIELYPVSLTQKTQYCRESKSSCQTYIRLDQLFMS